ncbi:hypothetical protein GLW00_12785 [Halobacillus litoralis]|uniref:Uncharacterized protein n=1 Tax=Halobacillus litoralis TaxID=45668 RepID=A0A845FDU6_9BACI|nr:hypothetical protein [Halobacillus litoralis]MYL71735.1 hypothetical protein [Halobacillus litoralis]
MSNNHSFTITISNNKTEKAGISYLQSQDERFIYPDIKMRKKLLELLGLPSRYSKTFDLIFVDPVNKEDNEVIIDDETTFNLIELKTTQKELHNNPSGFFFGATENEFNLAEMLGDRYKFCFVCLHSNCPSYQLLTLEELRRIIKTKRIQYQINL